MSKNIPELIDQAIAAKANSHSPYGNRPCGAAIETDLGIFLGTTYENCAYPNSICAVRCAVVNALSSGASKIIAVGVSGWRENQACNICGACREILAECGNMTVYLHISGTPGNYLAAELATLLPRIGSTVSGAISSTEFSRGQRFLGTEGLEFSGYELDSKQNASEEDIDLMKKAVEACKGAYVSVSHFPVGAAVLTDKGIFTGANIENSVLGLTLCAERTALSKAISNGAKKIHKLAITCYKLQDYGRPCGGCRQNLVEFGDYPIFQIMCNHETKTFSFEEGSTTFSILPNCFSPAALE